MKDNSGKIILALLAGASAGVIAGLLMAPDSGMATRDGLCSVCHVRLRPQVFQLVRTNDAIIQCDSC